jgi:1,2-diacylglycerol 3-alpha-glucosyltransferase
MWESLASSDERTGSGGCTMKLAVCFTNFGPYHLARLRALAARLAERGDRLVAYEVAGSERTYPWTRCRHDEPFEWTTLFPDRVLEAIAPEECRSAMVVALEDDRPDALGIVGYARPESMTAARWARRRRRPTVLMSESQEIDRPRVWWKELIKRRRVGLFDAAVVGGPSHRDYLVQLGMDADRIALGYNAVDNDYFATAARRWREDPSGRIGLPAAPYFLSVCRFVPEKNLIRLIEAFARYRRGASEQPAWDLVLCGDGPGKAQVEAAVEASGFAVAIHRPGFLQVDDLPRWYAHAGAFVLPSLMEPWGLVANEAAASGLPLLVSRRAGCSATLVLESDAITGARFDPTDVGEIAARLSWMAAISDESREAMGRRAAENVALWGPDRFAQGNMEAIERSHLSRSGHSRSGPATTGVSPWCGRDESPPTSGVSPICREDRTAPRAGLPTLPVAGAALGAGLLTPTLAGPEVSQAIVDRHMIRVPQGEMR